MKNNMNSKKSSGKNKYTNQFNNKGAKKAKNNRALLTFVCVFMSLVLLLGGGLLAATIVRQSSYAVKYEGFGMDTKTTRYFAAYYKYKYLVALKNDGIKASDTEAFWSSIGEGEEKSYGEKLTEGAENFVKQTVVAATLFDKYGSLSKKDKEKIEQAISFKLNNTGLKTDGSEESFDLAAAEYGFDYSSYKKAIEILYKASNVRPLLGGLLSDAFPNGYNEYLSTYVHVRLLFVDNNKKRNDKGELVNITAEEKAEREQDLDALRGYIQNGTAGVDVFESYFKYNTVIGMADNGEYYFGIGEAFTDEFAKDFSVVLERAFEMELTGDEMFSEVAYDGGVCFIYKTAPTPNAYADQNMKDYFLNFEEGVQSYLYDSALKLYSADAVLSEKFADIDIIKTPYNYEFFINF